MAFCLVRMMVGLLPGTKKYPVWLLSVSSQVVLESTLSDAIFYIFSRPKTDNSQEDQRALLEGTLGPWGGMCIDSYMHRIRLCRYVPANCKLITLSGDIQWQIPAEPIVDVFGTPMRWAQ